MLAARPATKRRAAGGRRVLALGLVARVTAHGLGSVAGFIARHPQAGLRTSHGSISPRLLSHRVPRGDEARIVTAASASIAAEMGGNPLITDKKGRAGGDGDGDGPTPLQLLQVVVYRFALIVAALCWSTVVTLDFFMTSGIDMIDGSVQASCLNAGDFCAGVAACAVPTGSLIGAGALLRLLGLAAIGSTGLSAVGLGALGALAGPACALLILAREIFWYGVVARGGTATGVLAFAAVALLRYTALEPGAAVDGSDVAGLSPVGPPVPLGFLASTSLFNTAFSKLFDPVGEDLDEEGEKWFKRSSRDLTESGFPSFKPDLSPWLPPVNLSDSRGPAEDSEGAAVPPPAGGSSREQSDDGRAAGQRDPFRQE
mmetsp:Transcript_95171/g.268945  ORF Transcript_95171/g.268945 Transcript_95171/m.268945 type:complete len:372 (+) Transcript_95171:69-1184(+)